MPSRRRIETIDELMDSLCDPGTLDDSGPDFDRDYFKSRLDRWNKYQRRRRFRKRLCTWVEVVFFLIVGIAFWLVLGTAVVSLFELF